LIPVDMPPADHRPHCIAPLWRMDRPDSIGSITSDEYPIRVHWDRESDQQKAADVMAIAELSWAVQVDQLGFRAPVLPDGEAGPQLDIYLAPIGEWEAWVEPNWYEDTDPGDGYNSTGGYIAIDRELPAEWIPSYVAHEFNHTTQFATDFSEETLTIWEATAVSAQTWTLGDEGIWDWDVADFQEAPWAPALVADGELVYAWSGQGYIYEYGAALWVMHLDQVLGDADGSAGPALWDATANEGWSYEPDVVDAVLEVSNQDLGTFMNGLARTRWLTGDRWDARGLPEAQDWTEEEAVPTELLVQSADIPLRTDFEWGPTITGQLFIEVDLDGRDDELVIELSSVAGFDSALWVLADGEEFQASGSQPRVELQTANIESLVIAISNLGPPDWDGDDDPWVWGDQELSLGWGEVPEAEPSSCGCASRSFAGGLPLALCSLLLIRRRRES